MRQKKEGFKNPDVKSKKEEAKRRSEALALERPNTRKVHESAKRSEAQKWGKKTSQKTERGHLDERQGRSTMCAAQRDMGGKTVANWDRASKRELVRGSKGRERKFVSREEPQANRGGGDLRAGMAGEYIRKVTSERDCVETKPLPA